MISLNTRAGFDTPFIWNGMSKINESASTSESVIAAFTISINIPIIGIKISTNPGFATDTASTAPVILCRMLMATAILT